MNARSYYGQKNSLAAHPLPFSVLSLSLLNTHARSLAKGFGSFVFLCAADQDVIERDVDYICLEQEVMRMSVPVCSCSTTSREKPVGGAYSA